MRWLLSATLMFLTSAGNAAPLLLDSDNRVLGYYANWQNPTSREYATSLTGYRFLFERLTGRLDSYANYLEVSYQSADCTGPMMVTDYVPPGYVMPAYGGFDATHPAPLVYIPQVPVKVIAVAMNSFVSHLGGCQTENRGPANFFIALPNDPAITGMSSSIFPAPARVASQLVFYDGFD